MSARLLTPAYRAALNGGTSGRPEFRGFHNTPSGRVLAWWADGSVAIRTRTGAEGDFAGEWTALDPLSYDALFVTDAVPADVPVADAAPKVGVWNGHGVWICGCDGFVDRSMHGATEPDCGECGVIRPALPDGAHWCECPFPAPKRGNMICGNCEGWTK